MIDFALRRATNIHWQALTVDKAARARAEAPEAGGAVVHRPVGLGQVDHRQHRRAAAASRAAVHTMLLDGDNVRHGLNRDLGFTDADRVENIRRVGEVAQAVGRCRPDRARARSSRRSAPSARWRASWCADGEFIEVFVDTPIEDVHARATPRASMRRRAAGQIKNFTGIDSPYEAPEHPDLRLETEIRGAGGTCHEGGKLPCRKGVQRGRCA